MCIASAIRLASFFFYEDIITIPRYAEYSLSNIIQISGSFLFLMLSSLALKNPKLSAFKKNALILLFTLFLLSVCYSVSYIFSTHNTKNNLSVVLIGIVMISIFFALELIYITITALFIVFLFAITISFTSLNTQQIFLNISTSGILAFVLFTCSRYGYYFKSQHFIQLKELEERNEEIQNLNHQKGEILGFVAHDLRNPLNNIEALSTLILTEEGHPDTTEVQLILNSAQHAKHIINDLIEVVQEKKAALKVQEVELIGFLKGIQNTWLTNTDRTRIINLNTDQNSISVNINPSKFTRVIDNLIGNAIKFSPSNTPVNIEAHTKQGKVEIRISDFGIGIPESLKFLLFDQFSKAGRTGLNGEKSMGLGLHISKDIIEQHLGNLTVESEENKGTTFIISILPAAI